MTRRTLPDLDAGAPKPSPQPPRWLIALETVVAVVTFGFALLLAVKVGLWLFGADLPSLWTRLALWAVGAF